VTTGFAQASLTSASYVRGSASLFSSSQYSRTFNLKDAVINGPSGHPNAAFVSVTGDASPPQRNNSTAQANLSAFANADIGQLQIGLTGFARGSTGGPGEEFTTSLVGDANARWQDTLTVSTGQPGKVMTAKFLLNVTGEFASAINGTPWNDIEVNSSLSIRLAAPPGVLPTPPYLGSYLGTATLSNHPNVISVINQPAPTIIATLTFQEGQVQTVDYRLSLRVTANASRPIRYTVVDSYADAFFDADFRHSLTWGGLVSIQDAVTGEPIENWTMTSGSGMDYSRPYQGVPEPSSLILLFVGTACWHPRCRRDRGPDC
jgi:hypothetical protein